jgi:DNA repair exonuclease SbcCD ATPase subunit
MLPALLVGKFTAELGQKILLGVAALAILASVYLLGYNQCQRDVAEENKKELKAQLESKQEEFNQRLQDFERLRKLDQQLIGSYQIALGTLSAKQSTITKEIVKYVPDNESCNLTAGAVGLLNDARQGLSQRTSTIAAERSDAKERAAADSVDAHDTGARDR